MHTHVSFVIPALNAGKLLGKTIQSIQNLNYPKDHLEIIVIDNGSTDDTSSIAQSMNAKVIYEPIRNRSKARNRGWKEARNNLIAFIDADVVLDKDWLSYMVESLFHDSIAGGQGKIIPAGEEGALQKFRDQLSLWRTYQTNNSLKISSLNSPMVNTAACLYRKSVLMEVNGFDELLDRHEDVDLSKRIACLGYHFSAVDKSIAHVYWQGTGWGDYLARSFDVGFQRRAFEEKWKIVPSFQNRIKTYVHHQKLNLKLFKERKEIFWLQKSLIETLVESGRILSLKKYKIHSHVERKARLSLTIFKDGVHAVDLINDKIIELENYHALPLLCSLGLLTKAESDTRLKDIMGEDFSESHFEEALAELKEFGLSP